MAKKLPYLTTNTALAVVAFLFRIPVTRHRYYDESFLRNKSMTAKAAFSRGILGRVDYAIHTDDHPLGLKIVRAFNEEKLKIEEGQSDTPLEIDPEQAARFAARVLMARKNFMTDLLRLIPFLRIPNPGSPQKSSPAKDGSYTVKNPGYKDIRIDADEKTREHLR